MDTSSVETMSMTGAQMFSQAMWFFLHALFALAAWGLLMGTLTLLVQNQILNADLFSPILILALSMALPFIAGYIAARQRPSDVATLTWLAGIVWLMVVGLWVLDMPTGPGACYRCGAGDKLWFTFFSFDRDSGMIDGQGRFFGTWPAAAMIGYSMGAKLAMRGTNPLYSEQ